MSLSSDFTEAIYQRHDGNIGFTASCDCGEKSDIDITIFNNFCMEYTGNDYEFIEEVARELSNVLGTVVVADYGEIKPYKCWVFSLPKYDIHIRVYNRINEFDNSNREHSDVEHLLKRNPTMVDFISNMKSNNPSPVSGTAIYQTLVRCTTTISNRK